MRFLSAQPDLTHIKYLATCIFSGICLVLADALGDGSEPKKKNKTIGLIIACYQRTLDKFPSAAHGRLTISQIAESSGVLTSNERKVPGAGGQFGRW